MKNGKFRFIRGKKKKTHMNLIKIQPKFNDFCENWFSFIYLCASKFYAHFLLVMYNKQKSCEIY